MENKTVALPVDAVTALDMVSEAGVRRKVLQAGVVEFMCFDLLGRRIRARPRVRLVFFQMHIAATDRFGVHLHVAGNGTDHLIGPSLILDTARQIHQPAAFGIGRHTIFDGLFDLGAQCHIRFQFGGTGLRKAASNIQAIHFRQLCIAQSIERHQLRSCRFQRVEVVGVVEAEGTVACDADTHLFSAGQGTHFGLVRNGQRFFFRQREQHVQIDLLRNGLADLLDLGGRDMGFIAGHQTEMAFDDAETLVVMDRADHRHVGVVFDDGAQLGFVPAATKIVEYDPGDVDIAVERLITEDQRCDTSRHAACVDHQHHRQVEQFGQSGIAVAAVQRQTVVQTLVALDQIHFLAVLRKSGDDVVVFHQVQIEIATGMSCGLAEPHRVDIIGAFFERLHDMAARSKRRAQAYADHGFPGGFMCCRDQHTVHGSLPTGLICDVGFVLRHEIQHAHADGGDDESNRQTAETQQEFVYRRMIESDLSVTEAAADLVAREDIERESLATDDEHIQQRERAQGPPSMMQP